LFAAVLLLAAASAASFRSLRHGVRMVHFAPPSFDADGSFGALRPHLGNASRAEYLTDRADDDALTRRLSCVQYALAPVAIRPEPRPTIRRNLLEGCTLVADFEHAGNLDAALAVLASLCDRADVSMHVSRVSPTLCLVVSERR